MQEMNQIKAKRAGEKTAGRGAFGYAEGFACAAPENRDRRPAA